jgi:hypothetical protein
MATTIYGSHVLIATNKFNGWNEFNGSADIG